MKSSACSTWEERAYRALESEAVGLRQPWRIQPPIHSPCISGESLVGQPVRKMAVLPHWGHLKNKMSFYSLEERKKGNHFCLCLDA